MKSDIQIAQETKIKHISEIADTLGIPNEELEYYGKYKAKLPLHIINDCKIGQSKLILVTAITPTPAGEGKTTTAIALAQALTLIGKKTIVTLREPSMGPVFGIKGGAAGGGYSQVLPMEDINLHFTGDISAVEKAHNLLSALIDNNLQNKKYSLNLDPRTITWKRTIDMNDRALRNIIIGLDDKKQSIVRETGFDIAAASEIMAILCISKSIKDLRERLGNIFIGFTFEREPIFAKDLKANGAMTAILKDAIKPNLVQTTENSAAIIHGGPFANIAQGTNSLIATKMAMSLADYVVTEAGFASELGAEKFFNIKCRLGELKPNAAVIVATIRALKYHGGANSNEFKIPNIEFLRNGVENLNKHIENIRHFGLNPIIAINKFDSDSDEEIEFLLNHCKKQEVRVALNEGWLKGGNGAIELANIVANSADTDVIDFKYLYPLDIHIKEKISTIATNMYGALNINYSAKALKNLKTIEELGLSNLSICMAKTQKSLSDKEKLRGRPTHFDIDIREIEIASGAGFIIPIAGEIMRMPGLPDKPSSEMIDIDDNGNITGLF